MEASRYLLREKLSELMEECGEEPRLYFQPPESVHLEYPCIIYHLKRLDKRNANNHPYFKTISFDITYITRDPTSTVPMRFEDEPLFMFDRYYTAENLHHYSYTYTNTVKKGS